MRNAHTPKARKILDAAARKGCPSAELSCVIGDYVRSAPGCEVTGEGVVVGFDGDLVISHGPAGFRVWNKAELVVAVHAWPGAPDVPAATELAARTPGDRGRYMDGPTVTFAFRVAARDAERLMKFGIVERTDDGYRLSVDGERSAWRGIEDGHSLWQSIVRGRHPSWWEVSLKRRACACCGKSYRDWSAMVRHLRDAHGLDPDDAYKPGLAQRTAAKTLKARLSNRKAVAA